MIPILRRHRYLLQFSLASLQRRLAKNITLLLIHTLIIFVFTSAMLFSHALQKEADTIASQSAEIIVQRMVAGRQALIPAAYLQRLGRLRGVARREGRLWSYFFDADQQGNYTMMTDTNRGIAAHEVYIGAGIAHTRGLAQGDKIAFRATKGSPIIFLVKGILQSESALANTSLVLMSEAGYRQVFQIPPGYYTDLVLSVPNPREVRKVAEKVLDRLPDSRPILREELLRTYDSVFAWRLGIVFALLGGAILAFVIFAWEKTSGLSIQEQREIGVLKAIGWETGDILQMRFWEGTIISLSAFALGYVSAYLYVFYGSANLFEPVFKGWGVLYPDFQPHPFIDGLQLITLFFFAVFPYIIATIIPIWRTAITDPDTVMR
jgi:ABC-type lipoprotein release transport system permease subunit